MSGGRAQWGWGHYILAGRLISIFLHPHHLTMSWTQSNHCTANVFTALPACVHRCVRCFHTSPKSPASPQIQFLMRWVLEDGMPWLLKTTRGNHRETGTDGLNLPSCRACWADPNTSLAPVCWGWNQKPGRDDCSRCTSPWGVWFGGHWTMVVSNSGPMNSWKRRRGRDCSWRACEHESKKVVRCRYVCLWLCGSNALGRVVESGKGQLWLDADLHQQRR